MDTLRERILKHLQATAATVPGIEAGSLTRERVSPVSESECPAMDLAPESEPDPVPVGAGIDRHELTAAFKIYTVGEGAYALADPFVMALHSALYVDPTLDGLAASISPGPTEFDREEADQTIGRTTVRYRITYTTRRGDLTAKA